MISNLNRKYSHKANINIFEYKYNEYNIIYVIFYYIILYKYNLEYKYIIYIMIQIPGTVKR